jgi:hypothetical protein
VREELVEDCGLRVADRVLARLYRLPMVRPGGGIGGGMGRCAVWGRVTVSGDA